MTRKTFLCGIGLISSSLLLAAAMIAQDSNPSAPERPSRERPAPPVLDEAAVQAAWVAYATPGSFHEQLKKKVGQWDLAVKWWPAPDAPPSESTATSTIELTMGGRFLLDRTTGSAFEGQPFEGMGVMGYDNHKKKFVSVWWDSMGTGVVTSEGTADREGTTITLLGQQPDMTTGRSKAVRTLETFIDADTWKVEMFDRARDRTETKTFEITYTRKK